MLALGKFFRSPPGCHSCQGSGVRCDIHRLHPPACAFGVKFIRGKGMKDGLRAVAEQCFYFRADAPGAALDHEWKRRSYSRPYRRSWRGWRSRSRDPKRGHGGQIQVQFIHDDTAAATRYHLSSLSVPGDCENFETSTTDALPPTGHCQ